MNGNVAWPNIFIAWITVKIVATMLLKNDTHHEASFVKVVDAVLQYAIFL